MLELARSQGIGGTPPASPLVLEKYLTRALVAPVPQPNTTLAQCYEQSEDDRIGLERLEEIQGLLAGQEMNKYEARPGRKQIDHLMKTLKKGEIFGMAQGQSWATRHRAFRCVWSQPEFGANVNAPQAQLWKGWISTDDDTSCQSLKIFRKLEAPRGWAVVERHCQA